MDYTNFVRTYYRIALQKLSAFSEYHGSVVDFDYVLNIPEDKKHKVERQSSFLPDYDVNINAENEYFEEFLDFYGQLNVDLGSVLLNRDRLIDLYKNFVKNGTDDDVVILAISTYVDAGIEYLKEIGVLE